MRKKSSKSTGRKSRSGRMCEPSRPQESGDATLLLGGSLASPLVKPDSRHSETTRDGYGRNLHACFACLDPLTQSWKTSQGFLFEDSETCSVIFPRSGILRNGKLYLVPRLVRTSEAREFISSPVVPRPVACDGKGSGRIRHERLQGMNLRDWWNVNYRFVYPPVRISEYLMGFPIGHTDLEA